MAAEPGAEAAGLFDPHAQHLAMRPHPVQHRPVSGARRREGLGPEHNAVRRDHGGHVHVLVRVDASHDLDPLIRLLVCGYQHVPSPDHEWRHDLARERTRQGRDATDQALIRSRARSRSSLDRLPRDDRQVRRMTPWSIGVGVRPPEATGPTKPGKPTSSAGQTATRNRPAYTHYRIGATGSNSTRCSAP